MKRYRFYKDSEGWFIDLPEYPGPKGDLAMVSGADTFLDLLAEEQNEVYLKISEDKIEDYSRLDLVKENELSGGGDYILKKYNKKKLNHEMWLCDVTKFVFGGYMPKKIYFKKSRKNKVK